MGIRGLLGILLGGMGMTAIKLIPPTKRSFVVSRMYIDMIQFVYKAIYAVKAEILNRTEEAKPDDGLTNDEVIIERTAVLLLQFIREISPREFLGIYFDGIPPLAKVTEQRARRYEMLLRTDTFNNAKNTVGTAFLRSVVERVMIVLADNASWLPPEIEVSTPSEPGEGEHKLASRIRDHDASLPGAKVIVADDGDVMIMALLNNFRDCYIYLDHQAPVLRHGLLSIGSVAERIRGRLGDTPTAVYDFCLMVILTGGNDFMPRIQAARDRRAILGELLDMYGPVLRGQPLMTNMGREIVWSSVRSLIVQLATNEERNLKRLAEYTKDKLNGKMPALYTRSMDPKTGDIKMPLFRKAWDDMLYSVPVHMSPHSTSTKFIIPESILIPRPTQKEIDADHAFSASLYLQGLSWTLGYMRTGDGPDWFYSSAFPPLFGDLSRVMASGVDPVQSMRSLPGWQPLPLAVYLLTILPRSTAQDLFGESFVNAFSYAAGIGDLFPRKFEHFSPAEWEPASANMGRAILPPLGLERIAKVVAERLDTDVIERNLHALNPRVRFSRSRGGIWTPVAIQGTTDDYSHYQGQGDDTAGKGGVRRTRTAPNSKCAEYTILDPVIPALTSA